MANKVYPIGYSKNGIFVEHLMQQEKMLLIDTRKSPNSKMKGFSGDELKEKYSDSYRFAGNYLGNVNYRGGPIVLAKPVTGIKGLVMYLREGHDLIILCGCAQYDLCHLKMVVELLKGAMPEIEVVFPECHVQSGMIKVISIRPPYATWLSNPGWFINAAIKPKTIENRNKDFTGGYRGLVFLHQSKTFETDAIPFWLSQCAEMKDAIPTSQEDYPLGAIVGCAELTKVITVQDPEAKDPWFCGPYGLVLANAKPIDPPIPYKGQLGLFSISESILQNG